MQGEGFAYFRWSTLMKQKFVMRDHWESLGRWPIIPEWRAIQLLARAGHNTLPR